MKKILITGCNGYVARNLSKYLSEYDLVLTNRNSLNLLDQIEVKNFFSKNFFDIVIHTAISGGSRLKEDNYQDFFDNCIMHQNMLENSCSFDKYISFGSGAELDRRYDIDTSCDLSYAYPIDPYGMSKNFIAKSGLLYPNFNNIRIFGVFNHDELSTRMIKANILNYIHKQPIVIHKDRWMDFFFMDDLCKVVKFVIDSDCKQKTINCCYEEKYKLSKIASYINQLSNYEVDIIIENDNLGLSYFGDYNLHLFDVELSGIQNGIVKTYKKLLETK
jgi:nucleoside-diphosphate-sugar epimerase